MNVRPYRLVFAISLAAVPFIGSAPVVSAAGPRLAVSAPQQTEVGKAIPITLRLRRAPQVTGYEAFAHFDETAAEFGGLFAGGEDATHVNVETTIADEVDDGTAFAVYTCGAVGCGGDLGSKKEGRRQLENVTLRIVPLRAGTLTISLDQLRFVDKKGDRIDIPVAGNPITVSVLGSSEPIPAPPSDFALSDEPTVEPAAPAGAAAESLDTTNNGTVTFADAAQLSLDWIDARAAGGPCQDLAAADVNSDGCVDVSDLQAVASTANAPTTSLAPAASAAGMQFTVNTTSDQPDKNIGNGICATTADTCSLRAALQESNSLAGANSIGFAIPGTGVHTIQLGSQLAINDDSGGVTIDGYSQPGAQRNTAALASNAAIMIEIRGNGTGTALGTFDGIRIVSANNRFEGLALYNAFDQIELYGPGANHNTFVGNFIGTNAAATFSSIVGATGGTGIHLEAGSNRNVFGTPALADRNVFDGAPLAGIRIDHENSDANVVQNNIFGLTPNGLAKRPNGKTGIDIQWGASGNIVGGLGSNERNVFSGHRFTGVDLSHSKSTSNNEVVGNFFGTTLAGNAVQTYTKTFYGITFKDDILNNSVHDNVIGGSTEYPMWHRDNYTGHNDIYNNRVGIARDGTALPNAKYGMYMQGHDFSVRNNIFANNALGGIFLTSSVSTRDQFTGNRFINNGGLAIDLAPAGPTANDAGDADTGPNSLLNYPRLKTATVTSVSGTTCASCRVEVYESTLDTGNRGEGRKLVGTATASTTGTFSAPVTGVSSGQLVAAITIGTTGNTSEFSTVLAVS
jgi:CSLREA domain-containing protein